MSRDCLVSFKLGFDLKLDIGLCYSNPLATVMLVIDYYEGLLCLGVILLPRTELV